MNKKMSKRQRDIKTKLMAAICMLLVSSIMMVSTTYAWFTLSTAPEVTGIQTAVGANGNLEMALMPTDGLTTSELDFGIESDVADSMDVSGKDVKASNVTWGNLVKLDEGYGLNQITLYPAELNMVTGSNKISTGTGILKTPKYGADGRVSELTAGTQTSVLTDGAFLPNNLAGVRAIGNASGLSERQVSFRNARGTMLDIASAVQTAATKSLTNNGKALANVVIKYADANESVKFDKTELASINTMITDLETMMGQIDTAYKNAVMAILSSGSSTLTDDQVKVLQAQFNQATSYDAFITALTTIDADEDGTPDYAAKVNELLSTANLVKGDGTGMVEQYKATAGKIATAKAKMTDLPAKDISWTQVTEVLSNLANPDKMLVNNKPKNELDRQELINAVAGGQGITIIIQTGGGAFADIADHCDNFTAKVNVGGISVQGLTIPDTMSANMKTNSNKFYLKAIYNGLTAPTSGTAGAMPITDFYGYIIDLAFRTNAAESKLLLQVDAADRIYDDNSNEETMGNGSNMTFASVSPDFGNDAMKELMKSIKVIFFNPQTGDIYVEGYLDADNAEVTAEGLKADLHIANATTTAHQIIETSTTGAGEEAVTTTTIYYGTQTTAEDTKVVTREYMNASGTKLFKTVYTPEVKDGETVTPASTAYYAWVPATTGEGEGAQTVEAHWDTSPTDDATQIDTWNKSKVKWTPNNSGEEIMDLAQNIAKPLSVLVYLDGTSVTNADVAYSAQTSMTGKLNLQFASSANLTAMEYADLHTPGATTAPTTASESTT